MSSVLRPSVKSIPAQNKEIIPPPEISEALQKLLDMKIGRTLEKAESSLEEISANPQTLKSTESLQTNIDEGVHNVATQSEVIEPTESTPPLQAISSIKLGQEIRVPKTTEVFAPIVEPIIQTNVDVAPNITVQTILPVVNTQDINTIGQPVVVAPLPTVEQTTTTQIPPKRGFLDRLLF